MWVRLRELGMKIWRLNSEMTLHDAGMTKFSQWWTRNVRTGYGIGEVYELHKNSPFGICKMERTRAVFWGGLLPLLIGFGALVNPAILWAALIYPIQICRVAIIQRRIVPRSFMYAL
jgi:hypothetical protein